MEVQVGTEKAWELCDKYNLPRMVYVTEMDMDDAILIPPLNILSYTKKMSRKLTIYYELLHVYFEQCLLLY